MAIRHWHLDSGAIRINNFPENEIQIAIPVSFLGTRATIAIDSTGVKYTVGILPIVAELLKHAKSATLYVRADAPSATDATVNCYLKDEVSGNVYGTISYAGVGGFKSATINVDDLKAIIGNRLTFKIEVVTASATAGATQTFWGAVLVVVLGIS